MKNNAKFCPCCGTKCSTEDLTCTCVASKEGAKKSSSLIIRTAAILIAIAAGTLAMLWHTSPEQKALRLVASRDYTSILAIIRDNYTLAQSKALARKINDRILFLRSGYEEGNIEYETVCTELDAMEQLGIQNTEDQLKDTRQTVYELYCERNLETFYLCTSQIEYRPGINQIETTWAYDEQGRLIEYVSNADNFDPEYTDYSSSYSYVYDDNGRIKEVEKKM